LENFKAAETSLTNIENNNGPKIDPWGTPDNTSALLENLPSMQTT
jgi:hypothetical protein